MYLSENSIHLYLETGWLTFSNSTLGKKSGGFKPFYTDIPYPLWRPRNTCDRNFCTLKDSKNTWKIGKSNGINEGIYIVKFCIKISDVTRLFLLCILVYEEI